MLRTLDLFAGIGGFPLAFERAGCTPVAFSEVEPFPCRVLAHRWPDVPNLGDVRAIRGADVEADVITGGFPCQDLSVAGKRAGLAGERSGLFDEIVRIAREMEVAGHGATALVLENVPGLFSANGGRDFAYVLARLAELGALDIAWRVLDAQHFGVAQRRRRVFLVVDLRGERAESVFAEREGVRGHPAAVRRVDTAVAFHRTQDAISSWGVALPLETEGLCAVAWSRRGRADGAAVEVEASDVSPALRTTGGGSSLPFVGVRRLTPRECERLQGFPDDWTAIAGAKDGPRYKALGNAVAVPVVEWIARRLTAALSPQEVTACNC